MVRSSKAKVRTGQESSFAMRLSSRQMSRWSPARMQRASDRCTHTLPLQRRANDQRHPSHNPYQTGEKKRPLMTALMGPE
jgi:hypothetical protein